MTTQLKNAAKDNVHVHFGEEADKFGKDNDILIQQPSDKRLSAHLGFLQIYHRYEIILSIPLSLWKIDRNLLLKEYKDEKVPNIHTKFCDIIYTENCANLKVELYAYKEKLLKEDIHLGSSDHGPVMCITLHARVLGKGKGTPLLRNGIHSIAFEDEDESEASDWQGFDKTLLISVLQLYIINLTVNKILTFLLDIEDHFKNTVHDLTTMQWTVRCTTKLITYKFNFYPNNKLESWKPAARGIAREVGKT